MDTSEEMRKTIKIKLLFILKNFSSFCGRMVGWFVGRLIRCLASKAHARSMRSEQVENGNPKAAKVGFLKCIMAMAYFYIPV